MGQALKKHPGGRPTKYNREVLDKTIDYILNYKERGDKIPTIAGLSQVLDTTRETITEWSNHPEREEFSVMVSKLMSAQEHELVNKGLDGVYNSGITKLILSKHGYSDRDDNQGLTLNIQVNRDTTTVEHKGQTIEVEHE
jgi:hypothetical protein